MVRTSVVGFVKIRTVELSSIVFAGDAGILHPVSNVLAVQRELPSYNGNEGKLSVFPLFTNPIPVPELVEDFSMDIDNQSNTINVGYVDIIGVSASSIIQIGSNHRIDAESRIKHIRQLLGRTGGQLEEGGQAAAEAAVPPVPPVSPVPPEARPVTSAP